MASMVAPGAAPQRQPRYRYTVELTSGETTVFEAEAADSEGADLVFRAEGRVVRRIPEDQIESWTSDQA